ncbi:hypothetical protein BBK36DRAFT_1159067 [Trichoderma citrinoviride]|uniref:ABM domain-containing protein n=1 Tax=Trichoderma citrinoviride TaxID=58853 RepID=A0A2T4BCS1_9HYPO|nr:hypothetical protein BBK36DRAFT_1159067 [Trichoderma citrinoviride]PTB67127.1 hypothetical protein BBK36DRAFT_1159067 [Trichoderma citrinoviride]
MSELIEISTFTIKNNPPAPPPLVLSALKTLAVAPDIVAVYFGAHVESPTTYTSVARWSSKAARDAFVHNPSFEDWRTSFTKDIDTLLVLASKGSDGDSGGDPAVPLEAPCTEIFTSFGAEDDYLENRLKPFAKAIASADPPGLVGAGFADEFAPVRHVGVDEPKAKISVLLQGWNSKADHEAQKGDGKVIDKHIHLVRSGRKSVSLFHVHFEKL